MQLNLSLSDQEIEFLSKAFYEKYDGMTQEEIIEMCIRGFIYRILLENMEVYATLKTVKEKLDFFKNLENM